MADLDADAAVAGLELVARTGARGVEVGYLLQGVASERAGWYAHARYQGARVIVEDRAGPVEAIEALARRLLTGGRCRCGGVVTLSDAGAFAGQQPCRWTRNGRHWIAACGAGSEL